MLFRGQHALPHQCQMIKRDLTAEDLVRRHWAGKEAHAYMLTDEQLEERIEGKSPFLPYRFIISSPDSAALAWTAFFTREAMQRWLDAYGFTLDREPEPGESFRVIIPAAPKLAELHDDGKAYEAGIPDPDHVALYRKRGRI